MRRPRPWTKGCYAWRIRGMAWEVGDGKPQSWVAAFVSSQGQDEIMFSGARRVAGERVVLSSSVANFVEI